MVEELDSQFLRCMTGKTRLDGLDDVLLVLHIHKEPHLAVRTVMRLSLIHIW